MEFYVLQVDLLLPGGITGVGHDGGGIHRLLVHVEEVGPDLASTGGVEGGVVQRELDAGLEGLVEGGDTVGGQN